MGFYYASLFLGNYINHQKDKISYILLDPVANHVYIEDLSNRLCVGWKTLQTLNFKLEFQTQISNSNFNFKTKIFSVLLGNPGLWEIYSMGKSNESNEPMGWYLGKAMS